MGKNSQSLIEFKELIIGLTDELKTYSNRDSANSLFIDKQNKLIQRLMDIYNELGILKYQGSWQAIEETIAIMEVNDTELNGFYIEFRTKCKNGHFGHITYCHE